MNRKGKTILNLFIILCMLFVRVPCAGVIATPYGIMGEVKPVLVFNNEIQEIEQVHKANESNVEVIKIVQVFNVWLLILATILFIKYTYYVFKLPIKETLVSRKVRMDN